MTADQVIHLRCGPADVSEVALLPGDPARVELIGALMRDFRLVSENREFKLGVGRYRDARVTVCSTGIGASSTEIAVVELARLGVHTFIRVGGCGSVSREAVCGDLVITSGAIRLGGASQFYARPEYPAVASYEVLLALVEGCERAGVRYHIGVTASIGSYYEGQGRASAQGRQVDSTGFLRDLARQRVINIEMESETVLTLTALMGLRGGCVCGVHCNRLEDEWDADYEATQRKAALVACEAAAALHEWDRLKSKAGRRFMSVGLALGSGRRLRQD